MKLPNTDKYRGKFRTSLAMMKVGDYIACDCTRNAIDSLDTGAFSNIGRAALESDTEFNIRPKNPTLSGVLLLTKVAPGTLLTNNIMITKRSWIEIVKSGLMYGKTLNIDGSEFLIRGPKFSELLYVMSGMDGLLNENEASVREYMNVYSLTETSLTAYYYIEMAMDTGYNAPAAYINFTYTGRSAAVPYDASYYATNNSGSMRFVLVYKENPKCTDFWH